MGDLISRSALLEELNNFSTRLTGSVNTNAFTMMEETRKSIERMIEEQPVAFDFESVIEQINDEILPSWQSWHTFCDNVTREQCAEKEDCVLCVAERIIEILNSATNATNQKECRENMKRQQAMKPKLNDMMLICPECGHNIKRCYWFCPECGQAILWGEDGGKDMNKLRKCKGKLNIYENGQWHDMEFELGYFHGWGVNYEEFADVGVGNYSVAIVELPDGRIVMPMADDIVFLDKLESRIKKNERKE